MNRATDAERWDERYRRRSSSSSREPAPFLREHFGRIGGGRALVLAMGEGRNAVFLAENGFEVTGIDVSTRAVHTACEVAAQSGAEVRGVVADLDDFDLGRECWELITDFYYLDRKLFPRIVEALAPGGWFVLETFSIDHPKVSGSGPTNPDYLLSPGELQGHLGGLQILEYDVPIVEHRSGESAALVRAIARKPLD